MSTQQTYEQRVRAIAEEMYAALYPKHASTSIYSSVDAAFHGQEAECLTMELLPAARIATMHMAEMAGSYLHSRFVRKGYSGYEAKSLTEKELKYQGLIPDQEAAPQLGILKPGEPGYGGYDPNNPEPDQEAAGE